MPETNYSAGLDMEALEKVARYFAEHVSQAEASNAPMAIIDPEILLHQIPGGMISNFRSQLEMQRSKLPEGA